MAASRVYTDEDMARAYVVLTANGSNIKRTTRDTGIPAATLRDWRARWATEGPPSLSMIEEAATDFVDAAARVRDKALAELERKIPTATPSALVATVGMLQDKINLARGLATARNETVHSLPSGDEIRMQLQAAFAGVIQAAKARDAEIIDAEIVEVETLALPQPAEQAA